MPILACLETLTGAALANGLPGTKIGLGPAPVPVAEDQQPSLQVLAATLELVLPEDGGGIVREPAVGWWSVTVARAENGAVILPAGEEVVDLWVERPPGRLARPEEDYWLTGDASAGYTITFGDTPEELAESLVLVRRAVKRTVRGWREETPCVATLRLSAFAAAIAVADDRLAKAEDIVLECLGNHDVIDAVGVAATTAGTGTTGDCPLPTWRLLQPRATLHHSERKNLASDGATVVAMTEIRVQGRLEHIVQAAATERTGGRIERILPPPDVAKLPWLLNAGSGG